MVAGEASQHEYNDSSNEFVLQMMMDFSVKTLWGSMDVDNVTTKAAAAEVLLVWKCVEIWRWLSARYHSRTVVRSNVQHNDQVVPTMPQEKADHRASTLHRPRTSCPPTLDSAELRRTYMCTVNYLDRHWCIFHGPVSFFLFTVSEIQLSLPSCPHLPLWVLNHKAFPLCREVLAQHRRVGRHIDTHTHTQGWETTYVAWDTGIDIS